MPRSHPAPAPPTPDDTAPPSTGGTTHVEQEGEPAPRLPHEHDQSSDSQQMRGGKPPEKGRRALKDLERGVVDTDLGPPLERARRTLDRQR